MNGTRQIRADLFPARVEYAGTVHDPVKVIIGLDRVWVYTLTGASGSLLAEWPLDDIRGSTQHGYRCTVDGGEMLVRRSTDCGCGANRSWKPWPYRLMMSPIPRA